MPKISVGHSFTVAILLGIVKVWLRGEGEYQDFLVERFLCLTVQKIFVGEPFSVSLNSEIEKFWIRDGGSVKIFRRNLFVSQC